MNKGIKLSPKYGVNPTIPKCYYCLRDKDEIVLCGKLPGDAEAPRDKVFDKTPCEKCSGFMKQGVILISVREPVGPEERDNPYRTGGWIVVTEDFIKRTLKPQDFVNHLLQKRVAFVPDQVWDDLGFPRGAVEGVPSE